MWRGHLEGVMLPAIPKVPTQALDTVWRNCLEHVYSYRQQVERNQSPSAGLRWGCPTRSSQLGRAAKAPQRGQPAQVSHLTSPLTEPQAWWNGCYLIPPRRGATESWTTMWVLPALLVLPLPMWEASPVLWPHKIAWWWVSQKCHHFTVGALGLDSALLHEQVVRWVGGWARTGQSLSAVQFSPPPSGYSNTHRAVLKGSRFHLRSFWSPFTWSPMLVARGRLLARPTPAY